MFFTKEDKPLHWHFQLPDGAALMVFGTKCSTGVAIFKDNIPYLGGKKAHGHLWTGSALCAGLSALCQGTVLQFVFAKLHLPALPEPASSLTEKYDYFLSSLFLQGSLFCFQRRSTELQKSQLLHPPLTMQLLDLLLMLTSP